MFSTFAGAAVLDTTPTIIRSILGRATDEQLAWRPNADRWSVEMVLAHLTDVEVNGFQNRFRAMAEESDPFLPSYDQHDFFKTARSFRGLYELDEFAMARAETISLLRSLPAAVLEHQGRHEELKGRIAFGELLNEFAFHDLGHIRQIAELYRSSAFYPSMGRFREYYTINP